MVRTLISDLRGISIKKIGRDLFDEIINGQVLDLAAQLGYYFLFALFPLLFFVVALAPYVLIGDGLEDTMQRAAVFLPKEVMSILQTHLTDLLSHPRPKLLSFSLLLALWSASRGVNSFRTGLNLAYDVTESRPFWRVQLECIAMTLLTSLLIMLSSSLMILGGEIGTRIAEYIPPLQHLLFLGSWLRWPVSALVIALVLALNYYMLPDVKQRFLYLLPGALLGMVLWLTCTWGFTQYVERLGNYNATYGSIGSVVVLMTWLYLTGLIFLLCGKLNALIEHSASGGKQRGARAEGEAPPPVSERPSGQAPGHVSGARNAVSANPDKSLPHGSSVPAT